MGSSTGDEECLPSWLDKNFIENALTSDDPNIDVSNLQLVLIEKVDGGYLSDTYRAVVRLDGISGDALKTSLIVKAELNLTGVMKDLIDTEFYTKEVVAYSHFLPAVNSALRAAESSSWNPLAPKLYLQGCHPVKFFVMEDLDAAGFYKVSLGASLDLQHCRAVTRSIARMHAASLKVLSDWQYTSKVFRQSLIFSDVLLENPKFGEDNVRGMIKVFNKYSWFHKYADKLDAFTTDICAKSVQLLQQHHADFKVMLHGDLHMNNMMFHADGDSLQVRFFDFQGLHIGSPAEDLQYFLHTSANLEVLQQHTDLLVSEYHSTLQRTLRALGLHQQADAYPLQQLRRDMDRYGLIVVYVTIGILPVLLCTNNTDLPTDRTAEDFEERRECFRQKICNNEKFLKHVEYVISTLDSKGLLEAQVA